MPQEVQDTTAMSAADSFAPPAPANDNLLAWLPDSVFKLDRTGLIRYYRPGRQSTLRLSAAEAAGRNIKALMALTPASAMIEAVAAALATGDPQLIEFNLTQKNKDAYYEARVTRAEDGTAWVLLRDISDWRRYEACDLLLLDIAIKVQEERSLEEILHLACERMTAIFGTQLLWVARKGPEAGVELFAGSKESGRLLKEPPFDLNDKGLVATALRTGKFQLMDIGDPRMLTWRQRLDGYAVNAGAAFPLKIGSMLLGALTVFSGDQDFWTKRTIVQLTNCAEQLAIAMYITTNRQRLRLLTAGLESAANAVVISDRNGDIQWVNPAFCELNGYTQAETIGINVRVFEAGRYPQSFYKAMRRHIASGKIWHGEIINRRRDGSLYTAEMTVTPFRDEKGKIANYITIIQDVTQRKKTDSEMLEAREALARAERLNALGIMAAGIAHEINQPLNTLKVLADGMLYWYRKGKTPDIIMTMETVQDISKEADRIDAIIKHMRGFIQKSQSTEAGLCEINQAVEASLSLLGTQLLAHNIAVRTELAPGLPAVTGNGIQLEQVIINLLVNAMNALDTVDREGKEITIITGRQKDLVFLAVGDNGPGISRAIKSRIFEPFFTTKPTGAGMGLGLSVVNSIVTAYGGQIKVRNNKPGAGVVFRAEFPVAPGQREGE